MPALRDGSWLNSHFKPKRFIDRYRLFFSFYSHAIKLAEGVLGKLHFRRDADDYVDALTFGKTFETRSKIDRIPEDGVAFRLPGSLPISTLARG